METGRPKRYWNVIYFEKQNEVWSVEGSTTCETEHNLADELDKVCVLNSFTRTVSVRKCETILADELQIHSKTSQTYLAS